VAIDFNFDTTTTDGKISQGIADDFKASYDYVKKSGPIIIYPDSEFSRRGIPTYRQTIAWKNLINKIGEKNFCSLNFYLNYLRDQEVLFVNEFNKIAENSKKLKVTFVCGYFWRFSEQRRYEMLDFVVNNILKKGITVNIWTQDETLKYDFKERMEGSELAPDLRKNLHIHRRMHRFDIHYTLIEDKDNPEKSRVFMELPHTEAHILRLETHFDLDKAKSFICGAEKFMRILKNRRIWNPFKSIFSMFHFALNIG
jgi:hypothetical protein